MAESVNVGRKRSWMARRGAAWCGTRSRVNETIRLTSQTRGACDPRAGVRETRALAASWLRSAEMKMLYRPP